MEATPSSTERPHTAKDRGFAGMGSACRWGVRRSRNWSQTAECPPGSQPGSQQSVTSFRLGLGSPCLNVDLDLIENFVLTELH